MTATNEAAAARGPQGTRVDIRDETAVHDALRSGNRLPAGWGPGLILILVALVDRIETSVVAGVLPLLQDEWGFSDTAGGAIPTAVAIAGMLVVVPAGYLADRVNRTRLIAVVVASWSVIIAAGGLATSFAVFFASRVVLGAADSMEGTSASSLLADYYPPSSRGKVLGFHRMAAFVGGGLGVLLGGVIGEAFGWRAAFFFMIIPGLVVAYLVTTIVEAPRGQMDRIVARLREEGVDTGEEEPVPVPVVDDASAVAEAGWAGLKRQLRAIVAIRTAMRVNVGITTLFIGLSGIVFWLPSYYERTFDLSEGAAGSVAALVLLVAVLVGTVLGGSLGDRWQGVVVGGRVVLAGGGLLVGALLSPVAFLSSSLAVHVAILIPGATLMAVAIPNLSAATADVLPASMRGIGFGVFGFLTSIGGAIGPLAVGAASDVLGSLDLAFLVLVVPVLVGSVVVLSARDHLDRDVDAVLDGASTRRQST